MKAAEQRVIGHSKRRRALQQLVENGRLPSATMLAGASGIGKKLVALELCRTLICDANDCAALQTPQSKREGSKSHVTYGGCGLCRSCRLFDGENYPDFHFVQCADRERWNLAAWRQLLYSLNLNAFAGKCRLILVDNAEYLSLPAANALLKSLEEPRPNTFFILVSASPSRLPPTILSRCQVWFFDSLSAGEIGQVLDSKLQRASTPGLASLPADELTVLCDGSLDGVETIALHYERWLELKESLLMISEGNLAAAAELATRLAKEKDKEVLRICLQLLRIQARDMMRKSTHSASQARWAIFLSNILTSERLIFERNLAPLTVLMALTLPLAAHPKLPDLSQFTYSAPLLERICV